MALLAAILLGVAVTVPGSVTDSVRADHPRLFFNRDTWPEIKSRAMMDGTDANRSLTALLEEVNQYPVDPVCRNTGPVFTPPTQPIPEVVEYGREAACAALAWRFTGEDRFLEMTKRMLRVSISAYREAIRNGRAVHWFSTRRILAICAYDWIFEALTQEERREFAVSLVEHVESVQPRAGRAPIIRRNGGGIQTGFYGVRSLLWYSGLVACGDGFCDDLASRHLSEGLKLNLEMMDYRNMIAGDDGGLSSGVPDYSMGAYPWAHFNFMHTYLSATGRNLAFRYPAMGLFPNWIWWNWIPTDNPSAPQCFGFGDDQHEQNQLSVGRLYEHMTQYMMFFSEANGKAARLAATLRELAPNRELGRHWPMYPFVLSSKSSVKPYTADELAASSVKARHFERLGQIVMRSGWKPDSAYCMFTIGADPRTFGHKHWDEGNFVIYRNGYLALDSGSRGWETDTNLRYYYAQTVAHNCVLVHKPGEKMPFHWGRTSDEPEAQVNHGGQYEGSGLLRAFRTTSRYTYVAADLQKVYESKCREIVRQFVHLQPNVFIVYDRVVSESPSYRKEWLLHFQNEPTVNGMDVTAACDGGRIFCRTLLPTNAVLSKVGGPGREFWSSGKNWALDPKFVVEANRKGESCGKGPYFGKWRLEVAPALPSEEDRFLHVLTAGSSKDTEGVRCWYGADGGQDVAYVEFASQDGVAHDTVCVEVRFNGSGDIGAELRYIVLDANGATVSEKCECLGNTIEPQSGVLL